MSYAGEKKGPFRGYYMTAYSLAVKHGFRGTEKEWVHSLNGESVMLRIFDEKIQWKLQSEEEWKDLLNVDELRAYVIEKALAEARTSAASAAESENQVQRLAELVFKSAGEAKKAAGWAQDAEKKAGSSAELAADQNISAAQNAAVAMEAEENAVQKAAEAAASAEAAAKAANEAQAAAGGGVVTFNGRTGAIIPQKGDYSPDMVGAVPADHAEKTALHLMEGDRENWNGKMAKGIAFELVLKADDWEDQTQVIEDDRLLAEGYACFVAPGDASWLAYGAAQIRAGNVTEDGKLTFRCESVPIEDLTVNILRVEVT